MFLSQESDIMSKCLSLWVAHYFIKYIIGVVKNNVIRIWCTNFLFFNHDFIIQIRLVLIISWALFNIARILICHFQLSIDLICFLHCFQLHLFHILLLLSHFCPLLLLDTLIIKLTLYCCSGYELLATFQIKNIFQRWVLNV